MAEDQDPPLREEDLEALDRLLGPQFDRLGPALTKAEIEEGLRG